MMYSLDLEEFMNPAVAWMSHAFFWITAIMIITVAAALFTIDLIGDSKITKILVCFACVSFLIWSAVLGVTATEKNSAEKNAIESIFQSIGTIDDWNTHKETVVIDGEKYVYTIKNDILFIVEAN